MTQIGKKYWDLEICRKSQKIIYFLNFIKIKPQQKHAKQPPCDLTPWTLTQVCTIAANKATTKG